MNQGRRYSDREKALAYAMLDASGNIKRTARELNLHPATLRTWKAKWDKEGIDHKMVEEVQLASADFLDKANAVRQAAIERLYELIPESTSIKDLTTAIGILSDKVLSIQDRQLSYAGMEMEFTPNTPQTQAAEIVQYMEKMLDEASNRHDIIDSEIVEQPEKDSEGE